MTRTFTVSDSIVVNVDPVAAYAHVSDVARMGESSPENLGATVADDRGEAYVGMVFDGRNKRGPAQWTTRCEVIAADPGRRFAFRVNTIGLRTPRLRAPIATWEYRFENADGGTRITETWKDDRRSWPDLAARVFDAMATRGKTFADFQRGNIERTLRRLKTVLETASAAR
jgi:hypothetical protein